MKSPIPNPAWSKATLCFHLTVSSVIGWARNNAVICHVCQKKCGLNGRGTSCHSVRSVRYQNAAHGEEDLQRGLFQTGSARGLFQTADLQRGLFLKAEKAASWSEVYDAHLHASRLFRGMQVHLHVWMYLNVICGKVGIHWCKYFNFDILSMQRAHRIVHAQTIGLQSLKTLFLIKTSLFAI